MRLITILVCTLLFASPARGDPLYEAVDAYALYQSDVTELLSLDVRDADSVDAALVLSLRHDPSRVAQGYLAYGALAAAQSPAFVSGVRSRVRAAGRAPVLRQLNRDITYARRRPPGSSEAIGLILALSAADSARLAAAGERYRNIGDTLAIGAVDLARRDARSIRLRSLSTSRTLSPDLALQLHPAILGAAPLADADAFGGTRFWDALARRASHAPPAQQRRENSAHASRIDRMLTLAGFATIAAGDTARTRDMLNDVRLAECLAIEQLELRQCASVSASSNEDAYCLARHGLAEPAACFSIVAAQ